MVFDHPQEQSHRIKPATPRSKNSQGRWASTGCRRLESTMQNVSTWTNTVEKGDEKGAAEGTPEWGSSWVIGDLQDECYWVGSTNFLIPLVIRSIRNADMIIALSRHFFTAACSPFSAASLTRPGHTALHQSLASFVPRSHNTACPRLFS